MRVVLVSYRFAPDIGGIETMSEVLARGLSALGHHVTVVTSTQEGPAQQHGYTVVRAPKRRELWRVMRDADVVLHNNPSLSFAWPMLMLRRPLVVAVHTWIRRVAGGMGWQDRIKFAFLRRADAVVSVSDAIASHLPVASKVIPNCYRDDLFGLRHGVQRQASSVAFVGRLVSDKGVDTLLEATSQLAAKKTALDVTIVGDGPERAALERLCTDLGIADRVNFTGSLQGEDLVRELNKHEVVAVPSRWDEPFGLVALEGMACGCIPVVSASGGLPQAVGEAGLTFTHADSAALASALHTVLTDQALRADLRAQAVGHLGEHTSHRVLAAYEEVLAGVTK